jgi:hypothetical protein
MKQCLVVCFSIVTLLAALARGDERILDLTVENDSGKYFVAATRGDLETAIDILFDDSGKKSPLYHYSNTSLVYARPSYSEADRLITLWETGTVLEIVIFRLAPPSVSPEIVFDKASEGEPDFFHGGFVGDLLLIYSGRYFVPNSDLWIPRKASLYLWDGRAYKLVKTVPYRDRYSAIVELDRLHNSVEEKSRKVRPHLICCPSGCGRGARDSCRHSLS